MGIEELKIRFDFNNMMASIIGELGISEVELEAIEGQIEDAESTMIEKKDGLVHMIENNLGVRWFSESTNNLDKEAVQKGINYMYELCTTENTFRNPASMFAILQYSALQKNGSKSIKVLVDESLEFIAQAYGKLWTDSFGTQWAIEVKEPQKDSRDSYTVHIGKKTNMTVTLPVTHEFTLGQLICLLEVSMVFIEALLQGQKVVIESVESSESVDDEFDCLATRNPKFII